MQHLIMGYTVCHSVQQILDLTTGSNQSTDSTGESIASAGKMVLNWDLTL